MFRFWPRSSGNQNVNARARERWRDVLMAQMANRAGVGRIHSMTMPHSSERRPYQQDEKRYREHRAPNSLLIRHFLGTLTGPEYSVPSVVQELHSWT